MSKPLTLTNREIVRVRDGLDAVANGVVDKAGSSTEITRFELDDKSAWNVAKNLDVFDRAAGVYQKRRKNLAAEHGVADRMPLTEASAPKIAKYQEAEEKLLDQTQELNGVLRLKLSDLQKGGVPSGVLRNLIPIIDE